jgi:short subunit dehydrogenase-like uncharacterized protein
MCHYVDINGEAEVYMKVDDLGRHAIQRERVMVAGAGHTAAASDLLLHAALNELRATVSDQEDTAPMLGAVRIALSRITTLSQGSLETLWRSMREQVRTIRLRENTGGRPGQPGTATHVIWHEPVGKLEREFDFFDPAAEWQKTRQRSQARRIASAANLLDTLTARLTVERLGFLAKRIESYVEAGTLARLVYQVGPVFAPLAALPLARDLVRLQLQAFPVGPTPDERRREPHLTVLEIDDVFHEPVLHWALHTPNPYDFTARIVLEIARRTTVTQLCGWLTPSELLRPTKSDLRGRAKYLRGCELHERRTPVLEPV